MRLQNRWPIAAYERHSAGQQDGEGAESCRTVQNRGNRPAVGRRRAGRRRGSRPRAGCWGIGGNRGWSEQISEVRAKLVAGNPGCSLNRQNKFKRQQPVVTKPVLYDRLPSPDQSAKRDLRPRNADRFGECGIKLILECHAHWVTQSRYPSQPICRYSFLPAMR